MARMKTIKVKTAFEQQGEKSEYSLDFNKTNKYKILFSDGYYAIITDKIEHILNDELVEAVLYSPDKKKKSIHWVNSKPDEAQYVDYNWFMTLSLSPKNNIYVLKFTKGIIVGGGVL